MVVKDPLLSGMPAGGIPHLRTALRDEVHVWLVQPASWRHAFEQDGLILSMDERAAAAAYTLVRLRERYRVAHCAVRRLLSLYDDRSPESWVFRRSKRGRPGIAGDSDLRFSLSYGDDLIAVAIARDVELGIDIVSTRRGVDALQIAEHAFAPDEIAELRSMRVESARERFFDYWALKEAYAKATGAGFWKEPRHYAFSFPRQGAIAFRHDGDEDGGQWQFVLAGAPEDHRLALATRTGAGRPRDIVARIAPGCEVIALAAERVFPEQELSAHWGHRHRDSCTPGCNTERSVPAAQRRR